MSEPKRKCYIHVGRHKTATTAIQMFLAMNRERLASAGVVVPWAGSCWDPMSAAHHELVHDLMGAPMIDAKNGGLAAVAEELRQSDARAACISSENLSFLWDNVPALTRLRDAVTEAGFLPQIIVYLRPQASYCTAVYAESVRQEFRTGFAAYFSDVLARGHWIWNGSFGPPFDYSEFLAPFAAIFGPEAIVARAYRPAAPNEAIFAEFAGLILPPNVDIAGFAFPLGRENRSLDFGTILDLLGHEGLIDESLPFAPQGLGATLRLWLRYRGANAKLAASYSVKLPVVERRDLALALPVRTTVAKTRTLLKARRALAQDGNQRTRVCYIHIGTHKTGTTSIQALLAANELRLVNHGVYLPTAGRVDDIGIVAHHELAKDLLGNPQFAPSRGGLEAVIEELRRTKANVACLTSEDLCFLYHKPEALIRLRDGIRSVGFEPRVVVHLRAQASYCSAVYAENVRHGYRASFEDYLADVLHHGWYTWDGGSGPPFDYTLLLDGFAQVFGKHAIMARAYRSGAPDNALLFSFARMLAPKEPLENFVVPKVRHNGSLSFSAVLKRLGVETQADEAIRFTPIDLGKAIRLGARFLLPNMRLAQRYRVFVPVFERIDLALALPWRKKRSKTIALARNRHALRQYGKHSNSRRAAVSDKPTTSPSSDLQSSPISDHANL